MARLPIKNHSNSIYEKIEQYVSDLKDPVALLKQRELPARNPMHLYKNSTDEGADDTDAFSRP